MRILFLLPLLLWTWNCLAAEPAPPISESTPLAGFMSEDRPLRLANADAELRLSVPVSPRMRIKEMVLHLEATNSTALRRERSRLAIALNGRTLAQLTLHPDRPEITADIRIPPTLLKNGYNELAFRVAQHYTLNCENPAAPELWTEIDSVHSTLTWKGNWRRPPLTLSRLGDVFDARLWKPHSYNILTASAALTEDRARWGALAAQGMALHLRYRAATLHHREVTIAHPPRADSEKRLFPGIDQAHLAGYDNILIGTRDELSPLLSEMLSQSITAAFLGVFPLDADPEHTMLVISGTNTDEVSRAALAFAMGHGFSYPNAPSMLVFSVNLQTWQPYTALAGIYPNRRYPFSELDFKTTTSQGRTLLLHFFIPPDLFVRERSNVELDLHFAYGAGLRGDSVLNIMINGFFVQAVRLGEQDGASYRDYRVYIPLKALQPGRNTITFEPRMMPSVAGECESHNRSNLLLTLFEDSTLAMPDAAHYTTLPDLGRFASTLFPYTVAPDGSQLAVHILDQDSASLAAAWMILAKMAQQNGAALYKARVSFSAPTEACHLIAVGPVDKVPPSLFDAAPARLGPAAVVPYPTRLASPDNHNDDGIWLERLGLAAMAPLAPHPSRREAPATLIGQRSELGGDLTVMQFESPAHPGMSTVLFSAQDRSTLQRRIAELVRPGSWGAMQGDFFVWRGSVADSVWQQAGDMWHMGDTGLTRRLEFYVSDNPWIWVATLFGIFIVAAWSIRRILHAYRLRHHSGVAEEADFEGAPSGENTKAPDGGGSQ